jgi:hypothetical protein
VRRTAYVRLASPVYHESATTSQSALRGIDETLSLALRRHMRWEADMVHSSRAPAQAMRRVS